MDSNTESLMTDELLRLVADRRRRMVLTYLRRRGTSDIRVDDPAAAVADDRTDAIGHRYERVLIELRHDHLPRLADAVVVEYGQQRDTVRYPPHEGLEDLLWGVSERLR